MLVDGKAIAEKIYTNLRKRIAAIGRAPVLTVITSEPNLSTQKYLALKEQKALNNGLITHVRNLPANCSSVHFFAAVNEAAHASDGVVVQLPIPESYDLEKILEGIPVTHDVDALNPETADLLSPVVGAIEKIIETYAVTVRDAHVVIVGSGKLVGIPAATWFRSKGAIVDVVTKETEDIAQHTKEADIVVCGAGVPGLLQPDMLKEGVVLLDAGTSEDGGELKGDADPSCASVAHLMTPVPGGIGPITVAKLLENVVICAERKIL